MGGGRLLAVGVRVGAGVVLGVSGSRRFKANGTTYTIPADKVGKFKLDNPNAEEI